MVVAGKDKLIVLDRDGVINAVRDQPITDPEQWQPLAGSMDAIAFLTQSGYEVVIAENMSGIGQGLVSMQQLNEVHRKLHIEIQKAGGHLTGIWFCPHTAEDDCLCRKPKPGMLNDILERLRIKPENTWLVGDGLRDMQAIEAIGGHPALVLTGKGKETLVMEMLPEDAQVFDNLLDFAKYRIAEDEALAKREK
ncbi:D-glycero-beta-D-manno-heptose 1,7-bisphosphate 7-phosphatase [Neisseriaceae bacterium ESL0693]|nr:D-glycero-beta-D-manno-heptose 1,7-bisphosphate 7-phosphatase [Neisseriaceae bacterium ESL0693]